MARRSEAVAEKAVTHSTEPHGAWEPRTISGERRIELPESVTRLRMKSVDVEFELDDAIAPPAQDACAIALPTPARMPSSIDIEVDFEETPLATTKTTKPLGARDEALNAVALFVFLTISTLVTARLIVAGFFQ